MTIDAAPGIGRILKQASMGWLSIVPACRLNNPLGSERAPMALGFHTERVSEPAEISPALRRALDVNTSRCPVNIGFICSQYPVYDQWVGRSAE
jgi:hypothetical protein